MDSDKTCHGGIPPEGHRGLLMERIYEDGRVVSDRTIDSHVKKLRRKLAEVLPGEELVHSVYGAGYRFEPRR